MSIYTPSKFSLLPISSLFQVPYTFLFTFYKSGVAFFLKTPVFLLAVPPPYLQPPRFLSSRFWWVPRICFLGTKFPPDPPVGPAPSLTIRFLFFLFLGGWLFCFCCFVVFFCCFFFVLWGFFFPDPILPYDRVGGRPAFSRKMRCFFLSS